MVLELNAKDKVPFPHRPAEDRRELYMVEVHGLKSSKWSSDWLTWFLFTVIPLIILLESSVASDDNIAN